MPKNSPRIPQEPTNVILCGPPGTGKTYGTRRRALELLGYDVDGLAWDADEIRRRFRDHRTPPRAGQSAQIEFVTFHQSYGYEDFVEGHRPSSERAGGDGAQDTAQMRYSLEPGILRRITTRALDDWNNVAQKQDVLRRAIDQAQQGNPVPVVRENAQKCWEWKTEKNLDMQQIKTKDIPTPGNKGHTWSVLRTLEDALVDGVSDFSARWQWLYDRVPTGNVCRGVFLARGKAVNTCILLVQNREGNLNTFSIRGDFDPDDEYLPNYFVLIMDEINRGNISKIFGELITLIEPGKRIGEDEELTTTLPYSREVFGVPPNLHLMGTMNTADRSIALIDVALRRRFRFEELMPDAEVLNKCLRDRRVNADVRKLTCDIFRKINDRIGFLYDRDHQIGHSYYMPVTSIPDLRDVLLYHVLPLLQEYFYNDWDRVCAVLGQDGKKKTTNRLITIRSLVEQTILGFDHDDYSDRLEYAIHSDFYGNDATELERLLRSVIRTMPE